MSVNRRALHPQYLHLYKKCLSSYRISMTDLAAQRYPECILNMYESLEFFWKAIFFLNSGGYPRHHLPSLLEFNTVTAFLSNYLSSAQISTVKSVFRAYNPQWQGNPGQRMRPRYGDETTRLPPARLYNKNKAQKAVLRSSYLARELVNVHRLIMLRQPSLFVGVLSGFFSQKFIASWILQSYRRREKKPCKRALRAWSLRQSLRWKTIYHKKRVKIS